jgi:SRSO17 transposase
VAVSSALIADGRTWPLAFDLYVPTSWTDDPVRCAAAGIPPTVRFREKWRIALAQIRTVLQAGFTITGVVVDADYGANAAFRAGLERLGLAYGVAIRGARRRVGTGHLGHGHRGAAHRRLLCAARASPRGTRRPLAAV